MARYKSNRTKARVPRRIWYILAALVAVVFVGVIGSRHLYFVDLDPVSDDQTTTIFTVEKGETVKSIAANLEEKKLIRSAWAMQLYIHSKELGDKLQYGTYALSPSQSTPEIVTTMTKGRVATRLVTILPGRRIDQVRADFINSGFAPGEVDKALVPSQYADLPVMAFKPANINTLEGLLWPDSFQKDESTSPSYIIRESLTAMGQQLTPDIQAAFAAQGRTTYEGIILASVILQEVSKPADQAQAAQVFYSRLKSDMVMGSDVTALYGAINAGHAPSLTYDSPYNTLQNKGLPPTPISTINASSLNAAAHPASTNWLYFVAGDDGTTYFSTNYQDHQALTAKYCHKLCSN